MVELVDTPDLGSGGESRGSSSLSTRTRKQTPLGAFAGFLGLYSFKFV